MRLVASLRAGTVLPSAMLKRLAAYQRQNQLGYVLAGAHGHVAELHVVEHALPQWRDGLCLCHEAGDGGGRSSMIYSDEQNTAKVAKVILH